MEEEHESAHVNSYRTSEVDKPVIIEVRLSYQYCLYREIRGLISRPLAVDVSNAPRSDDHRVAKATNWPSVPPTAS